MISHGRYSHASDVWSFGVMAWELYAALINGARFRERSLPYFHISNDEVILYLYNPANQKICFRKNTPSVQINYDSVLHL